MRKTLLLILFLMAGVLSVYVYYGGSTTPIYSTTKGAVKSQPAVVVSTSRPQVATFDDYVEKLTNAYRLKPDQRFLKAVAEIHRKNLQGLANALRFGTDRILSDCW